MKVDIARRTALAGLATLFLPLPVQARKSWKDRPVIVLVEHNPWAMVVGGDSASFALYLDGTVIFRAYNGFRSVKLEDREMVQLMAQLDVDALSHADSDHETTSVTDQRSQVLYVFGQRKRVRHYIYGAPVKGAMRTPVWPTLVAAYDRMLSFNNPRARTWLPEKIEVMIWPYEHAVEPSIVWPQDWPGLDDPGTRPRHSGQFSLYLPSLHYLELVDFLKTRREKGAVEIDGRKWSVGFRFPFPNERLWMQSSG